jgi:hypothetical protein
MKNSFFVYLITLVSIEVHAQKPEDAIRLSWLSPGGSARQQAIGGAMVSLGGDISSKILNPAG